MALQLCTSCSRRLRLARCVSSMAISGSKRVMPKRIGTHSGSFHCDEALGVFLLRQTKEFEGADIIRTRDPEVLKDLDAVIDVGGVYDAPARRFDHHQKGFEEVMGGNFNSTRLSSAGLVYKHFGREIVAARLGAKEDDPKVEQVFWRVYQSFIESVDAVDNGIDQYDTTAKPRYVVNTDLPRRVAKLNPWWNQESGNDELDSRFAKASEMCGKEFLEEVDYWAHCWLPARDVVVKAIEGRNSVHSSGSIIKLETPCPWKDHLYEVEEEMGIAGAIKFVLYFDDREKKWRIQAVNLPSSFELRQGLRAEWRGLRGEQLDEASGITGCVFVHASGFIGGHNTEEGALEMAARSL